LLVIEHVIYGARDLEAASRRFTDRTGPAVRVVALRTSGGEIVVR
jgi:hypothetical protein